MGCGALGSVVVSSASGPGGDSAHQGVVGRCEEALEVSARPSRDYGYERDGRKVEQQSKQRKEGTRRGWNSERSTEVILTLQG